MCSHDDRALGNKINHQNPLSVNVIPRMRNVIKSVLEAGKKLGDILITAENTIIKRA